MTIKEKYNKEVIAAMKKVFGYENDMQVPRIAKVVVNIGIGKFIKDSNMVKDVAESLAEITGQKPIMTKSRKSIAGFKIREGLEVGAKVTLRGVKMWNFIEKLVGASLPRVRDFQGLKETAIDSGGNLNIGIKEHMIFPEISPEKVKNIFSLQVNVATTAKSKEDAKELFKLLGFPVAKK